jgi:MSHA biogenesis protein MshJ
MDLDFKKICEQLDQKTLKYRALVLCGGLLVVYFVWNLGIQGLMLRQKSYVVDEMEQLKSQLQENQDQANKLSAEISQLSHPELVEEQQILKQRLSDTDLQISKLLLSVSTKDKMLEAAVQLLKQTDRIVLVSIKSAAAESVPTRINSADSKVEPMKQDLLKNSFEIIFEADFFSTLSYLERLENNDRQFLWQQLHYTVTKYPKAKVSLFLSFLSEG